MTTAIITGGSGFIGSHVIRQLDYKLSLRPGDHTIVNIDCLTYAGANNTRIDPDTLNCEYIHRQLDIADEWVTPIFQNYLPTYWIHAAAESHVDRAIDSPSRFVHTNINGTAKLLDAALECYTRLSADDKRKGDSNSFRFLYVSTDEVYGPCPTCIGESDGHPLGVDLLAMRDGHSTWHPLQPRNPYAASKAAAEHLCMSYYHTYGLPVVITRGCNTYGFYQMPEKFLPLMILKAWRNEPLPLYGDGMQRREWISAEDHASQIIKRLLHGAGGEIYNIGSGESYGNASIARKITNRLKRDPSLITYVEGRPGHDRCYKLAVSDVASRRHRLLDVTRPFLFDLIYWYTEGHGAEWCKQFDESILERKGTACPAQ